MPNWWNPRWDRIRLIMTKHRGPRRQRALPLDDQSFLQLCQLLWVCFSFHLRPVGAPVAETGIGEPLLQATIGREHE